jgi:hypothetical protein
LEGNLPIDCDTSFFPHYQKWFYRTYFINKFSFNSVLLNNHNDSEFLHFHVVSRLAGFWSFRESLSVGNESWNNTFSKTNRKRNVTSISSHCEALKIHDRRMNWARNFTSLSGHYQTSKICHSRTNWKNRFHVTFIPLLSLEISSILRIIRILRSLFTFMMSSLQSRQRTVAVTRELFWQTGKSKLFHFRGWVVSWECRPGFRTRLCFWKGVCNSNPLYLNQIHTWHELNQKHSWNHHLNQFWFSGALKFLN